MYLTQWLYAAYVWTEAMMPIKPKFAYLDYWQAAATQPGSCIYSGDMSNPLRYVMC